MAFFWQGGERIEIEHAADNITIEIDSATAASAAAERAGVRLAGVTQVGPNLVRAIANAPRDRDSCMAQLRKGNIVHHVYRAVGETDSEYFITETFFVKFKPDTARQSIDDFVRNERLEVEDMGDGVLLCRVTDATGRNSLKTANVARSRADVEYAEPNLVRLLEKCAPSIPGDTLFPRQWHLHAPTDDADLKEGAGVFAADAWELSRGRRDIVICVADDGCDISHPDFRGVGKIINQLNVTTSGNTGISYDSNVTPRPGDYHGTPCSGVAVAEQNGVGTVGVAPGCGFLPVRFPLSVTDAQLAKLFKKISREADVVSCSWGYPPGYFPMSTTLRDTVADLAEKGGRRGKGLIICVAAGNNNAPVKDLKNTKTYRYRTGPTSWRTYSGKIDRWLAAHPDVITVSGCTSLKKRSCYSSWGKDINVCAPTDNWDDQGRITPKGRGIVTTDNEGFGPGSDFTPNSRYTDSFGGTSSATPTVAGVCGLVLSRNPNLTATDVRNILQDTADKDLLIQSETPVNAPGDFDSGFSLWYGHGKVNAFRAVEAAVTDIIPVRASSQAELAIPDNSVRVEDTINIETEGLVLDIRLQVDVEHTYIGDLEIDVVAPDGTAVSLHNHEGGAASNLQATYSTENLPGLVAFQGRSIQGAWTCRITDTWSLDQGVLKSWRIVAKVKNAA